MKVSGFYVLIAVILVGIFTSWGLGYRRYTTNVPMVPASTCVQITGETK